MQWYRFKSFMSELKDWILAITGVIIAIEFAIILGQAIVQISQA